MSACEHTLTRSPAPPRLTAAGSASSHACTARNHGRARKPYGARRPSVLIIDTDPDSLDALGNMLERSDFAAHRFPRPDLAFHSIFALQPDLIMLDLSMPALYGADVLARIRNTPHIADIPIIYITDSHETESRISAIQTGGVDFVTRPPVEHDVISRIRTHLALKKRNNRLEEIIRLRSSELAQAHRKLLILHEEKTHWINMLAHELRTPLTSIICTADILFKTVADTAELSEMKGDFDKSCQRVVKLIDDATYLAALRHKSQSSHFIKTPVFSTMTKACSLARHSSPDVMFTWSADFTGEVFTLSLDDLFPRALCDLLVTAACCTPTSGTVAAKGALAGDAISISISTSGNGLPENALATFFEVGGQQILCKGGADFGLGPALARRVINLGNGEVSVSNGASSGIVISVLLPLCKNL